MRRALGVKVGRVYPEGHEGMSDQSSPPATHSTAPPVDLDQALAWVDQDRELLAELVGVFLQDYPLRLAELREAIAQGDAPRTQRVAHGLKGVVAGFGAKQAKELALRLELIGKSGDLAEAESALADLEAELARVAQGLSSPEWKNP